jgi:DnaJ-domain-containing protein 1
MGPTEFTTAIATTDKPSLAATALFAAWIATSNGVPDESHRSMMSAFAGSASEQGLVEAAIESASSNNLYDLQLACEALRQNQSVPPQTIVEALLRIAAVDQKLSYREGQLILLAADALLLTRRQVDEVSVKVAGKPLPAVLDPMTDFNRSNTDNNEPLPRADDMQRLRDLAALGLDETATSADIRLAYRRMCQVHHPDRFAALGPDAVRQAQSSFLRIQQAYERLGDS